MITDFIMTLREDQLLIIILSIFQLGWMVGQLDWSKTQWRTQSHLIWISFFIWVTYHLTIISSGGYSVQTIPG